MENSLTPWLSPDEIGAAVGRLAAELDRDYEGRMPVLVGVLTGSFMFMADLVRRMRLPIGRVDFIKAESYGAGQTSSGHANIVYSPPGQVLAGRNLVVVEDIIDTGITTAAVLECLGRHRPESMEVCALLDKPSRREVEVPVKYVGVTIPDRFVVGYGMDLDQRYRELPGVFSIPQGKAPSQG